METSSPQVSQALSAVDAAAAAGTISKGAATNLERWLSKPAYRAYHPRLLEMIRAGSFADLDKLFWEVIPFGTGGRRGPMAELGSATINERTIAESAHGMAVYLKTWKGAPGGRAVIAHDTRHRSTEFARMTATTLCANGLTVFLFDGHRATPELSFAVRHLACDIGVMISASHNPPSDNGFKAYWSNGAQVLPPHDRGIIECVNRAEEIPTIDFEQAIRSGGIEIVSPTVDQAYIDAVASLALAKDREIHPLYTPLHGVGETSVYPVVRKAGFTKIEILESQRSPDGGFPNVPGHLPNPELNAALQPAVEQAQKSGAELVLASDPDADRLGVAVRGAYDNFLFLTGNQVGALLLDFILRKRAAAKTLSAEHFVATTLVTTPMIRAIGQSFGVRVVDDLLVGFKYIGATVDALGPDRFLFGVEESLGYLSGSYCRDKDAALAALYVLELAAELKTRGWTLAEGLDDLYSRHGYFVEAQRSESCQGARGKEQIDGLMRTLRTNAPARLGGISFVRIRDYETMVGRPIVAAGGSAHGPAAESTPLSLSMATKGDLVFLDSAEEEIEFSIAARPSGTEPKIKFYFFAKSRRRGQETVPVARLKPQVAKMLRELQDALSAWVKSTLEADRVS